MKTRHIVAMGGFAPSDGPGDQLLDGYLLSLTGQPRPKVCFLSQASEDGPSSTLSFYRAFAAHDCRPSHLSLFAPHTTDIEGFLLDQDAIYVGGGNTKSMLALWRDWGLDGILRKAWHQGVVLGGVSAGANCWHAACSTDSFGPGTLRALPALGFVPGGFCPHFDGEPGRRPTLRAMVLRGEMPDTLACDDAAAIHYLDDSAMAVASLITARAYRVTRAADGRVSIKALPTRYLGK